MFTKGLLFLGTVPIVLMGASTALWAQPARFAYVANCGDVCLGGGGGSGNVSAYTIDRTTGALTPVPGSPFLAGLGPVSVTVDPTGAFAYVANIRSDDGVGPANVSAYKIDGTTGALTEVAGSPFPAGLHPFSVTVAPIGSFGYVTNSGDDDVSAYMIDRTTGALTEVAGAPFPAGANPRSVTADRTGSFAYVANFSSDTVSAYMIDRTTGALTDVAGSPFLTGPGPSSVTTTAGPRSPVP